jgi:hypothetical protein
MKTSNFNVECPALVEMATADLYRGNAFRILGLRVTASSGEARRIQQRREMQARLGIAENPDTGGGDTDPNASAELSRKALEYLNDPEKRLLDEIFWFWPVKRTEADPALDAIDGGDYDTARELWLREANLGEAGIVAAHNLAVLHHMRALGVERGGPGTNDVAADWAVALEHWNDVCSSDAFWDLVRSRVEELDDQKLTTGFVRRIRNTMPIALAVVNARILQAAAVSADKATQTQQAEILRRGGFESHVADEALKIALQPLRNRLKQIVADAKSRWESAGQNARDAVTDLHEQATPLLAVFDGMLPEDDVIRKGLHDLVAESMLIGEVAYVKHTNDWNTGIELLRLALGVVAGQDLREKLERQIEVNTENDDLGNDWCAPGYWDLPADVLATTEAARKCATAGDFDGALEKLLALDARAGTPLERCVAYCLSLKAIRIGNEALEEYNQPAATLKRLIDKVTSSPSARLLLICRPDPNSSAFMNPPCPACGTKYYTSWTNFEYKDVPMFWCSDCSHRYKMDVKKQESTLKEQLEKSLRYMLLAEEVDPVDSGIKRNLEKIRSNARESRVPTAPDTSGLRASLAKASDRAVWQDAACRVPHTCFFCGEGCQEGGYSIKVPMHGNLQTIPLIFGTGREFRHTEIVIPRCQACHDSHAQLVSEIEVWNSERDAAGAENQFPELRGAVLWEDERCGTAAANQNQEERAVAAAEAKREKAEQTGQVCARCGSDAYWDDLVCKRCDSSTLAVSAKSMAGIWSILVAGTMASSVIWAKAQGGDVPWSGAPVDPAGFIAFTAVGLSGYLWFRAKRSIGERRAVLVAERAVQIEAEKVRMAAEAASDLKAARAAAAVAAAAAEECRVAAQAARDRLAEARADAVTRYEQQHPHPAMLLGIRREEEYDQDEQVLELIAQGWEFGSSPAARTDPARGRSEVAGLVTAVRSSVREHEGDAGLSAEALTDAIKRIVDAASPRDLVTCPVCGVSLKARNLSNHCGRVHRNRLSEPAADAARN